MTIKEFIQQQRRTNHVYHEDAGHGWLKVEKPHLRILGIHKEISSFSYENAGLVYLEEDMDAITYLKALFPMGLQSEVFKQFQQLYVSSINDGDQSTIRSFNHYNPTR